MAQAKSKTKSESVYRRLKLKLERGEFEAGQQITETQIAGMFGVGRGPARESMLRLVSEGTLAKDGAYGRTFVRYIEEDNRAEVVKRYELREMIEGLAARLAADNMTGRDVRELRRLDRLVLEAITTGDREARLDACLAFHRFLLGNCGNDVLLGVAESANLLPMLARSPELDVKLVTGIMPRRKGATWLTDAVKAIADQNPEEAERAMRGWIRRITQVVRDSMEGV